MAWTEVAIHHAQAEAALRLWSGQGTFVFTGSAGIYAREDGSRVSEGSETQPLGKDERTDRWRSLSLGAPREGHACMHCPSWHACLQGACSLLRLSWLPLHAVTLMACETWSPQAPLARTPHPHARHVHPSSASSAASSEQRWRPQAEQLAGTCCRLLRTEAAVLGAGGCVVRLAGLYHAQARAAPLSSNKGF